MSTACHHLTTNSAGMCPGAGPVQQENTPTKWPGASPGAVALPGYPLTAVEAEHGFSCWLCHRDCPGWQRMSLLVAGQPHSTEVREQGSLQLLLVPKPSPAALGRGVSSPHRDLCATAPGCHSSAGGKSHIQSELPQLGQCSCCSQLQPDTSCHSCCWPPAPSACPAWAGAVHEWDETCPP